jgi:uncharacterized protein
LLSIKLALIFQGFFVFWSIIMNIKVEKPDADVLEALGVFSWPTWAKEISTFPWSYNAQEVAYILEGEVTVVPKNGGSPVTFSAGDLVTFPAGLSCIWHVKKNLLKHYQFS